MILVPLTVPFASVQRNARLVSLDLNLILIISVFAQMGW